MITNRPVWRGSFARLAGAQVARISNRAGLRAGSAQLRLARNPGRPSSCNNVPKASATDDRIRSKGGLRTVTLPNGLTVCCVNEAELRLLYEEVFGADCSYLQNGITLSPGGVVLDIGANIGLFTLLAAQLVGAQGRVLACEPVPILHQACLHNTQQLAVWLQQHSGLPAPTTVLNVGVGDGSSPQAEFLFYTGATGWSSMYPDDVDVQANMRVFLDRALTDPSSQILPDTPLVHFGRFLHAVPALAGLYQLLVGMQVRSMLRTGVPVQARMVTISEIIAEHELTCIDLIKIDVERAELDVLKGVSQDHWSLIQQVVIEVHDQGSRVKDVVQLLTDAGLSCVLQQDSRMLGTQLCNVYARRTAPGCR